MPAVTRHPELLLCQAGSSVLSGDTGPEEGRQTNSNGHDSTERALLSANHSSEHCILTSTSQAPVEKGTPVIPHHPSFNR